MRSYYNIPKAIFYLLKGDYRVWSLGFGVSGLGARKLPIQVLGV